MRTCPGCGRRRHQQRPWHHQQHPCRREWRRAGGSKERAAHMKQMSGSVDGYNFTFWHKGCEQHHLILNTCTAKPHGRPHLLPISFVMTKVLPQCCLLQLLDEQTEADDTVATLPSSPCATQHHHTSTVPATTHLPTPPPTV